MIRFVFGDAASSPGGFGLGEFVQPSAEGCVLLFSGGRDSTLAALRLAPLFERLILVTVTSEHLVGIESVHRRLAELKRHLPGSTRWLQVAQPREVPGGDSLLAPTCLPCHRAYTVIGAAVAAEASARSLAFGYTSYQSNWVEQTPAAIARLTRLLASLQLNLALPVYDIPSKDRATEELYRHGLSPGALEQKCLQQQFNVELSPGRLEAELNRWEQSIAAGLAVLPRLRLQFLAELVLYDIPDSSSALG